MKAPKYPWENLEATYCQNCAFLQTICVSCNDFIILNTITVGETVLSQIWNYHNKEIAQVNSETSMSDFSYFWDEMLDKILVPLNPDKLRYTFLNSRQTNFENPVYENTSCLFPIQILLSLVGSTFLALGWTGFF
jgi:hypothetical protein